MPFSNCLFLRQPGAVGPNGPGSIKHSSGQCIHVKNGAYTKPASNTALVLYYGCGQDRLEFQLTGGNLKLTKYNMCVGPRGGATTSGTVVCVISLLYCFIHLLFHFLFYYFTIHYHLANFFLFFNNISTFSGEILRQTTCKSMTSDVNILTSFEGTRTLASRISSSHTYAMHRLWLRPCSLCDVMFSRWISNASRTFVLKFFSFLYFPQLSNY